MKKKVMITVGIFLAALIVSVAGFFGYKKYESHENLKLVDQFLQEKNWEKDVESEDVKYSPKIGVFYKEVKFKDEPNVTYVIQPMSAKRGLYSQAFNNDTKKNDKKAKRNFYDESYKVKK